MGGIRRITEPADGYNEPKGEEVPMFRLIENTDGTCLHEQESVKMGGIRRITEPADGYNEPKGEEVPMFRLIQ